MDDTLPLRAVHHVELYVGNAKQASYYYRHAFGFSLVGYRGPETGTREAVSYALQQNKIRLILTTPLFPDHPISAFINRHGDGVRDIALETTDAKLCYEHAVRNGAVSIAEPATLADEHGSATFATVAAYADTVHTFVEKTNYAGPFLPTFAPMPKDSLARPAGLTMIDHIVNNMSWNGMEEMVGYYDRVFGLSRFVSFDDKDISTEYSALKSTVVANKNKWIKFPINEPAVGKRKSQIEEYVDYNQGPGVQHIAMMTDDIVATISTLKAQGVEFLMVPTTYYDELPNRVGPITEDIATLAKLGILVDRDDKGYMLQLFTKPVEDRPTLFYEIIQRRGGESFGKGNFKALFESIEREQERRGNL